MSIIENTKLFLPASMVILDGIMGRLLVIGGFFVD